MKCMMLSDMVNVAPVWKKCSWVEHVVLGWEMIDSSMLSWSLLLIYSSAVRVTIFLQYRRKRGGRRMQLHFSVCYPGNSKNQLNSKLPRQDKANIYGHNITLQVGLTSRPNNQDISQSLWSMVPSARRPNYRQQRPRSNLIGLTVNHQISPTQGRVQTIVPFPSSIYVINARSLAKEHAICRLQADLIS